MDEEMSQRIADLLSGNAQNFYDYALGIVAILICLVAIASGIVSIFLAIKYVQFNHTRNSAGLTGVDAARKVLDDNGLQNIKVSVVGSLLFGNSYSHYFKKVRLRRLTRNKESISALAMGVQKSCLAILDKEGDSDMKTRVKLVPLITFGPFMFVPLIIVGIIIDIIMFNTTLGACTAIAGGLGILFFALSLILSISTLTTETKAQERALRVCAEENLATPAEIEMMKELFKLYNIEYINNIILSALELLYKILQILSNFKASDNN